MSTSAVPPLTDLEGDEFEQDSVNLAAWQEAFQQHHYWAVPLGPVLAIGLSTVRFRSNVHRWGWLCVVGVLSAMPLVHTTYVYCHCKL